MLLSYRFYREKRGRRKMHEEKKKKREKEKERIKEGKKKQTRELEQKEREKKEKNFLKLLRHEIVSFTKRSLTNYEKKSNTK